VMELFGEIGLVMFDCFGLVREVISVW
jgi:hypothetical protein